MVEQVFVKYKRRYVSLRIIAELKEQGFIIGCYQMIALMKRSGLKETRN